MPSGEGIPTLVLCFPGACRVGLGCRVYVTGNLVGIEVKLLVTREVLTLLSLEIIELFLNMDPCRQVKVSQPWFFVFLGPAGLERVSVSTCPAILFLQVALVCW